MKVDRRRGLLLFLTLVAAIVVATSEAASAHAQLVQTDPASGAVLTDPPAAISLTFNEGVEISLGGIRLLAADGHRLVTGEPRHADGTSTKIAVELPQRLDNGTYVVSWRALSADSHPVQGAFTFSVGESSTGDASARAVAARELSRSGGSRVVGITFGAFRFVGFAALAVVIGGLFFTAFISPRAHDDRRLQLMTGGALLAALLASAIALGLEGVYAGGYGLSKFFSRSVWSAVIDTRFGHALVSRLIVLALLTIGLLFIMLRRSRGAVAAARPLSVAAVVALPITVAAAGHATTGSHVALAFVTDSVHVAAMGVWLGGLVALLASTRGAALATGPESVTVVQRYSRIAFVAVACIAVSGVVQGWRQTGERDALTSTTYGRLLLAKVAIVIVIVGIARTSRRHAWRGEVPPLRRLVAGEIGLAAVVLALTAILVNTVPAKADLAKPFDKTVSVSSDRFVQVVIDPAKSGTNTMHLYFTGTSPTAPDVAEATARLSLPAAGVGPLDIALTRAGPSHFVAQSFDVPLRGSWSLEVRIRVGDFDSYAATIPVTVR